MGDAEVSKFAHKMDQMLNVTDHEDGNDVNHRLPCHIVHQWLFGKLVDEWELVDNQDDLSDQQGSDGGRCNAGKVNALLLEHECFGYGNHVEGNEKEDGRGQHLDELMPDCAQDPIH